MSGCVTISLPNFFVCSRGMVGFPLKFWAVVMTVCHVAGMDSQTHILNQRLSSLAAYWNHLGNFSKYWFLDPLQEIHLVGLRWHIDIGAFKGSPSDSNVAKAKNPCVHFSSNHSKLWVPQRLRQAWEVVVLLGQQLDLFRRFLHSSIFISGPFVCYPGGPGQIIFLHLHCVPRWCLWIRLLLFSLYLLQYFSCWRGQL